MAKKAIVFSQFEGGWSTDPRIGLKNSQAYTQAFDFRKNPSQLSVLPGLTREDGGVAKDLLMNEVMTPIGTIYGFGNAGYLYRRTTAGVWSEVGKLGSGTAGLDYRKDTDSIYATSNKTVSAIKQATTAPTLLPDTYAASTSTYNNSSTVGFNVNAFQTGSPLTTSVLIATNPLNEASTNVRYFQTDIEPLSKVSLFITAKGTGNWTVTLHDGLNNVLATSTVTNTNLNNNAFNDFIFTTAPNGQVRVYPAPNARTYHIHVTSTVADGTVSSSTVNDLSSCDLEIWADRLIQTNNGLHPLQRFLQYECFGNSNYLSIWEPISDPPTNAEWQRHALVFPEEYEVCGLAVQNEFLVIAAEKNTNISGFTPQQGILFFWDGVSPTYNYFIELAEGSPYALDSYKNVSYYENAGDWYGVTSSTTVPTKLRHMPGSDTEFSGSSAPLVMYPYSASVRRGVQLMGYPGMTTSTTIPFGVYSYGSVDKNYPNSFGLSYVISTGSMFYTAQNNLQIGMVQAFGDLLHVSWRDDQNGGYGIDVITNSSKPSPYAKWQSLVYDGGFASKPKTGYYMEVYYPNLPSGVTVTMGYSLDSGSTWTSSPAYSSTNLWLGHPGVARLDMGNARFYELQLQIEVACDGTVTTPPIVQQIVGVFDDNKDESL